MEFFCKLTTRMLELVNKWILNGNCDTLMDPLLAKIDLEWSIVIAYIFRTKRMYEGVGYTLQMQWCLKSTSFIFVIRWGFFDSLLDLLPELPGS